MRIWKITNVSLVFAALAVSVSGCGKKEALASLPAAQGKAVPAVRTVKPSNTLDIGSSKVTGVVRSKNETTLASKITAQIRSIAVNVGDVVKKGQVLVRLDASNAAIQRQSAEASLRLAEATQANAKLELDRATTLSKSGALSRAEFERSQTNFELSNAQLDQARASVRAARQELSDSTIVAPFSGVISAKHKNTGDTVASMPPTAILSLVDPDNLEVSLSLPEALGPFAAEGEALHGVVSPSGAAFSAKVRVSGVVVDTTTRTIQVLADVPKEQNELLKPGSIVTVDFSKAETLKGPFLPADALKSRAGKSYVLLVVGDKVEEREVVALPINPGTFQIKSGLALTDTVALDKASALRSGDKVAVLEN